MPPGASVGTLAAGKDDESGRAVGRAVPVTAEEAVAVPFARSAPDRIEADSVAFWSLHECSRG